MDWGFGGALSRSVRSFSIRVRNGEAVKVQQQQFACPSAGAGEDNEDAHRLLVTDPTLLGRSAEQSPHEA